MNVCWRGLIAVLIMLASGPVWAQRVQFPTMVSPNPADASGGTYAPATAPSSITPLSSPPGVASWDPYASTSAPPPVSLAQATPYSPYAPSPYAPPPGYAPQPAYAPAPTYSATPSALYPDPALNPACPPAYPVQPFVQVGQPLRFLQTIFLRDTWLASSGGSQALTVNDVETSATFAVPVFFTQPPVLITPGFGVHFFGGPSTMPPDFADLPPRTYDAYLDGAWQPRVNEWLSFNLGARGGIYSDFHAVNTHSIRIMGRGLGIIAITQNLQFAVGAVYLDRNRIKLLPAGGFIWTPNPDARYEILFPNPKLAHRLTTVGTTDVWIYVAGEYGGGAWTIRRAYTGVSDDIDYNDCRVMLGLDTFGVSKLRGMMEVGYVFNRQILYRSGTPQFDPSDTVMIRAGLTY
jgi:hypothetical protein